MSDTRVFVLDAAGARSLEHHLKAALPPDAEWRRVDHARFAVKAMGVSLVCYTSGKVVLQGKSLDAFVGEFLAGAGSAAQKSRVQDPDLPFDAPTIGSDEAGKGDYFGPLVVASVYAEPERKQELVAMGIADSKTLSDQRMFPMAEMVERGFDCEVRVLMPSEYNARWNDARNVNHVLAELHADAIAALLRRHPEANVLVDRFGDESLIADRLATRLGHRHKNLVQVPRAEAHPVVGAASVVARVRFVEGFQECEAESGTDLHKGGGEPVDVAARRAFAIGGRELMSRIAKLHFKNSERIHGLRP
ncbi:MAG: ribonuclease [Planctomycetota bacterium]|jgi:ribonuclease HIII